MSMHIAEDKIADIKNAADIVEIITDYVVLKKTGKNYVGLCPFHSEKTPSFTVSSEKQIFHCFGCGEGGNVFTFLMKKDGLSFPDAIRLIGKRYGIEIPEKRHKEKNRGFDEKEILYNINKMAMMFYKENLQNSKAGKMAFAYLKNRGMKNETISEFDLGCAPEGWNHLLNYFSRKEVSQKIIEKAGLVIPRKDKGGYYDRFRNRIIFPISDMSNRVIGFGGRVMDDSLPKYLNSPETPVFNKGSSLYGLSQAKQKCRDSETVYIAEGYFDLLSLHQHGIENSVATLGTSLTGEHVQLLRNRYVGENGKVILVYDSDVAGIKAAQRSVEIFKQGYVDAQILVLPDGFDPDSYLFKFGRESFLEIAEKALSSMLFLIDSAVNRYGLSIEGKNRIVSDMIKHFVMIKDEVIRSLYAKELAERLGIDETAIVRKINDAYETMSRETRKKPGKSSEKAIHDGIKKDTLSINGQDLYAEETRIEKHIIAMMLQFPEILPEIKKRDVLKYFQHANLKSIGQMIINKMSQYNGQVSEILDTIDNMENRNIITSLAMGKEVWNLDGCLKLIKQFESSRSRYDDDLLRRIKAAEDSNDDKLLLELLKKKQAKANTFKHDLESSGGKSK
ncbi:MAG: DNA primase [Deltaproteobacteria bacterium]|nr:DNA primase [Deltaproteobacteria bacterium]MBW2365771.1 DNA primase [Deltaproteobacteria bacterium]